MASNPVFNEGAFERAQQNMRSATQVMTLQGTINKTFLLLFLCVVGGMLAWKNYMAWIAYLTPISLGALVIAFITCFRPKISPFTAPVYAFAQGLLLGIISAAYNARFQGIVFNAVAITLLVFFFMLFIYRLRIIPVTKKLRLGITSATAAIAVFYIGSWLLSLFGVNISYLTSASPLSIGISVVVCAVAAFNFLLDFDFIDQMTGRFAAPKFMEWYAGFGLVVTLVWLYIEILNLLGKMQSRK